MTPLKALHSNLIQNKLDGFHKMDSEALKRTLAPGQPNSVNNHRLKAGGVWIGRLKVG
jgi:hypothetical protein